MLSKKPIEYYEEHRDIITELAVRSSLSTNLATYFIGKKGLATRRPDKVDYDFINHICLNYYRLYYNLFTEAIITREDLDYRTNLILSWLPRAIIVDSYKMTNSQLRNITKKLCYYFDGYRRFNLIILPLLSFA